MAMMVPLPLGVRNLLQFNTHPGLMLDKYVTSWDPALGKIKLSEQVQRPALEQVVQQSSQPPAGLAFAELLQRWRNLLHSASAQVFQCTTTGPTTLHLARASALENAGICLHPLYGFVFFPGSGLKGMARCYAETIWLPEQFVPGPDGHPRDQTELDRAIAAWHMIEEVFGWAPGSDLVERGVVKPWKPKGMPKRGTNAAAAAGSIVYHDGWPTSWPALVLDIVNNHHPDYYGAEEKTTAPPPGDWEDPVPVYFLAVKPDTTFVFAVSPRRSDLPGGLVQLAKQWLIGALCHLGAGAKTAAGYGYFKPVQESVPVLPKTTRATFETPLELVTPAFLAGADHKSKEACNLRGATLRGLLRWWWRTMHAGFVDAVTLLRMESAIWGNTKSGSPLQLVLRRQATEEPQLYDKQATLSMSPQQKRSEYGIPDCDAGKTTQGLWYLSFGTDEKSHGERKQRYCLAAPSTWSVELLARKADNLTVEQVLNQAKAALWLLCTFGGVGSKARKGFGSLHATNLQDWSKLKCLEAAIQCRKAFSLPASSVEQLAYSSTLGQMLGPVEVAFPWPDIWFVLDQVGFAWQTFAKKYKHHLEKKALGLPHKIGPGIEGSFQPTGPLKKLIDEMTKRRKEETVRHSSPVHLHLARSNGQFVVSAIAFPAAYLPDLQTSRVFLSEFLADLKQDLEQRAALPPPAGASSSGPVRPGRPRPPGATPAPPSSRSPNANDRVQAVVVADPKGKNRLFAQENGSGFVGPILQPANVPPDDRSIGKELGLIVASINVAQKQIQFRYPHVGK